LTERLQPVRGTQDILPATMRRFRAVAEAAREVSSRFGYEEIATPIFEFTEVFKRPIGETTDIVMKEMYSFTDKGGEEVALRPENTAGVMRAIVSNGLTQSLPLRLYYQGPMFRYERPQKGRFRQFHQIGIELVGVKEPEGDVETIALGAEILDRLGVLGRTVLQLNTLGDSASRSAYRAALVEYFRSHAAKLSEDSRARLDRNPLRILDSKDEGDKSINAGAPAFGKFLSAESRDFYGRVKQGLDRLQIRYQENPLLVRGLDYYCHTAFEFVTGDLGAQGTVLGGGRYDGLAGLMGGPDIPAVGWAAGIERLALLLAEPDPAPRAIALVPIGAEGEALAQKLALELRRAGFNIDLAYSGNLQKRMRRADKIKARAAVILGEDELKRGVVAIRDLDSGTQSEAPLAGLAGPLADFRD
jgi:histidyl-tRNA synthetase